MIVVLVVVLVLVLVVVFGIIKDPLCSLHCLPHHIGGQVVVDGGRKRGWG